MKDREPTQNIVQELAITLNDLIEKHGEDPHNFDLHKLYLILSAFTALTLHRAFESLPSVDVSRKYELIDQYCDVLKECLRAFVK